MWAALPHFAAAANARGEGIVSTKNETGDSFTVNARSIRSSRALWIIAAVAVGAVLFFGHQVFVPLVLALLFSLVLSSTVESLYRRGLPRVIGAVILLGILMGALGGVVDALREPAQQWFVGAPKTLQVIERKIRPLEKFIQRAEGLTQKAGQLSGSSPPASDASSTARTIATPPTTSTQMVAATGETIASIITVVILTLFLLSGGPPMLARMTASLGANLQASYVLKVVEAIRVELGCYYGTIALINLGLGLATAVVMRALGIPNPFLWGAVVAVFNFIPYVGSATSLLLLSAVALVAFDDMGRVLAVIASFLGLTTIEGQVVQPLVLGRRLELNPIIVFLAVWFGGWFWGVPGIVIAVPALVAVKVAASHSEASGPIVEILGPTGSDTLKSLRGRVSAARSKTRMFSPAARKN
jgi:predicted PurR-regulated permease PerM